MMTCKQAVFRKWAIKNFAADITEETGTNARFFLPLCLFLCFFFPLEEFLKTFCNVFAFSSVGNFTVQVNLHGVSCYENNGS